MKTYTMSLMLQVEVEASDISVARDIIKETFGEKDLGDLEVVGYEILDEEVLD